MLITRQELINECNPIIFKFDFDRNPEFEYRNEIYRLDQLSHLIRLTDIAAELKDYEICKIANNILAVYETSHNVNVYTHKPVLMHIELSDFCNSECIMCKHCYERNINAKYLPADSFDSLLSAFPACRIVIINGYGEPFLHPDIKRILSVFDEYKIKVLTTTNLQVLPPDIVPLIGKVFMRLNVSCDGATADTYESIRRRSSFDSFVRNVSIIREQCPDVELFMSVVSMRQNLEESVEIVRLAKKLGFEEVRFGRLGSNVFLENQMDELINYPNYSTMILEKAVEEAEKQDIRIVIPLINRDNSIDSGKAEEEKEAMHSFPFYKSDQFYNELSERFVELLKEDVFKPHRYSIDEAIPSSGICHWIGFGAYMNSSGKIRPCVEIPYNREQEEREEPVDFNNSELVNFRNCFIGGHVPEVCMDCAFIMSDEVGCLHVDDEKYRQYFVDKANKYSD